MTVRDWTRREIESIVSDMQMSARLAAEEEQTERHEPWAIADGQRRVAEMYEIARWHTIALIHHGYLLRSTNNGR